MNNKEKIQQLKTLKESLVRTKTKLVNARKLEESLRPARIGYLIETELEQAEIILASKDILTKLQGMAEDLAKMQADAMPISDSIKEEFGPEASEDFDNAVSEALQTALAEMRSAKDKISNSILRIEGKEAPEAELDIDIEKVDDDLEIDDIEDVFAGSDASSGPKDEPLGRGMKESYKNYGKRLLVRESFDSLVGWLFEDVAGTMDPTTMAKFAGQISSRGARDAESLAGWIGSRKYGSGVQAQLASPFMDVDDEILDESAKKSNTNEGKSFRHDDDEDEIDVRVARKASKAARKAARDKYEIDDTVEVVEGKSYKHDDEEDDDIDSKKRKSSARRKEAGRKREIEETVKQIIERNIRKTGKGLAAKAIAEAQGMYPMIESDGATIAEAFEARYGMTPQAYSLARAKAIKEEVKLAPNDEKNAALIMAKVASDMESDKSLANKGVQTALNKLNPNERTSANKVINNAKSTGKTINSVADFVSATKNEISDDSVNENIKKNSLTKEQKDNATLFDPNDDLESITGVRLGYFTPSGAEKERYFDNPHSAQKFAFNLAMKGGEINEVDIDRKTIQENINAANWPINTAGQYKGEPMSTDYNKLTKAPSTPSKGTTEKSSAPKGQKSVPNTPKGADEPSDETPWDIANKAPSKAPEQPKASAKQPKEEPLATEPSDADTTPPSDKVKKK